MSTTQKPGAVSDSGKFFRLMKGETNWTGNNLSSKRSLTLLDTAAIGQLIKYSLLRHSLSMNKL